MAPTASRAGLPSQRRPQAAFRTTLQQEGNTFSYDRAEPEVGAYRTSPAEPVGPDCWPKLLDPSHSEHTKRERDHLGPFRFTLQSTLSIGANANRDIADTEPDHDEDNSHQYRHPGHAKSHHRGKQ